MNRVLREAGKLQPGDIVVGGKGEQLKLSMIVRSHKDDGYRRLLFEGGEQMTLGLGERVEIVE
jgi:hypothetical protein